MNEHEKALDAQYSELIETVWACERAWTRDDRIDAQIRFGNLQPEES
jgi:hypothetical protein